MKKIALLLLMLVVAGSATGINGLGMSWNTSDLMRAWLDQFYLGIGDSAYWDTLQMVRDTANTALDSALHALEVARESVGVSDTVMFSDTSGCAKLLQGKDTTALWNAKTLQGKDTSAMWKHAGTDSATRQVGDTVRAIQDVVSGAHIRVSTTVPSRHTTTDYKWLWLPGNASVSSEATSAYEGIMLGTNIVYNASWKNEDTLCPGWQLEMRYGSNATYGDLFQISRGTAAALKPGATALTTFFKIDNTGKTGIGTTTPKNRLDVKGATAIGATYSGTNTAPANGLLVEGSVAICSTAARSTEKLFVKGDGLFAGPLKTDSSLTAARLVVGDTVLIRTAGAAFAATKRFATYADSCAGVDTINLAAINASGARVRIISLRDSIFVTNGATGVDTLTLGKWGEYEYLGAPCSRWQRFGTNR